MKRVIIKESKWGHSYLLGPKGKKCCLGFACTALGLEDDVLYMRDMPASVGVHKLSKRASRDLVRRYEKETGNTTVFATVAAIAAHANDRYHKTRSPARRKVLLSIMRQAFREVGLQFVLRKA